MLENRCCAIIPAAGNSTRMAMGYSKQFISLLGVPTILYTLKAFEQAKRIHEIVVVGREQDIPQIQAIANGIGSHKCKAVVPGGTTRQQSVAAGMAVVSQDIRYVAIHDGARPLISPKLINAVVEDAFLYRASSLGVPVKDTIKTIDSQGLVVDTPKRDALWAVQTPQVFERDLYRSAMDEAVRRGADYTDDCQLIENFGARVHLCRGDYNNLKLTTQEDILLAEAILSGTWTVNEEEEK